MEQSSYNKMVHFKKDILCALIGRLSADQLNKMTDRDYRKIMTTTLEIIACDLTKEALRKMEL